MLVAVVAFLTGWILCTSLMIKLVFLAAWLIVAFIGISLLCIFALFGRDPLGDFSFWLVCGAMMPELIKLLSEVFG